MTSVLKRYAQLEPRTQYFIAFGEDIPTYTFASNRHTGVADITDVVNPLVLYPVTIGSRLKDLGNTVYVYDTDPATQQRVQVAVMRLVQPVNGQFTEGNSAPPFWIATWVSTPPVYSSPDTVPITIELAPVARTG